MDSKDNITKVNFLGINISIIGKYQLLDYIIRNAKERKKQMISCVNIHSMNIAAKNNLFAKALNASDILYCDGFGVKIGAYLSGIRLDERITSSDYIEELLLRCEKNNLALYLLGEKIEITSLFQKKVKSKYPKLKIIGQHHGYFNLKSKTSDAMIKEINRLSPDIILTAMGQPKQEMWAYQALNKLKKGIIIDVGALFLFYTRLEKRSPGWMTDNGLEWLGRLIKHPIRNLKRYVFGIPEFFYKVIKAKL